MWGLFDYEKKVLIIIIAEMAVFNVAGYLIEKRLRWPVITASHDNLKLVDGNYYV